MKKDFDNNVNANKLFAAGFVFISIFGTLQHFFYGWFTNPVIAFFSPVNESTWEHLKLAILPTAIWAFAALFLFGSKRKPDSRRWLTAMWAAQVIAPTLIVALFYSYTGAIGFNILWADIATFFVAVGVSQLIASHIYKHSPGLPIPLTVVGLIAGILIMGVLTFVQPQLPFFTDPLTGMTGII